jgi:hydrogenase maturation protein HypF
MPARPVPIMRRRANADGPEVLAVGAWLKNAACRLRAGHAQWSPVHGDLSDPQACVALEASMAGWLRESPGTTAAIAHDLHPDFFSTRLALRLAGALDVPAIGVQHHHAHIAAVMAEHGVDAPVIGLALDGVGLGTDGQAWGGELLRVDADGFQRLGHLSPLQLPGGDVAAREPWRMAASALHALGRGDEIVARFGAVVGPGLARGVAHMLAKGLKCPSSTSTGRWFDAAAGALGLSVRQAHEAEAAIALEDAAARGIASGGEPREVVTAPIGASGVLDLRPLLAPLFATPSSEVDQAAAGFHAALAVALADWAAAAAEQAGVKVVCLGGGCFFNAVLTERLTRRLHSCGLRVLRPMRHSCGDAGLAFGQAWVAAHRLRADAVVKADADAMANILTNESLSCV